MAFFVAPYALSMPADAVAGHLALFNNRDHPANTYFPPTVGVEFDAFANHGWDPNDTNCHIGVDVSSIRSTKYMALPDGIFNGIMSATVRYDPKAATLSATLRFLDPLGQSTYRGQRESRPAGCRSAPGRGGWVLCGHRRSHRAASDSFLVLRVHHDR
jgi:hypothetical protein